MAEAWAAGTAAIEIDVLDVGCLLLNHVLSDPYVDVALARLKPHRTPAATPEKVRLSRRYEFFDPGKAIRELGLPQTPVNEALRKAVDWYRTHGYAP